MSKMVPKVMINMNEYIPSGILGKRVKLDFSKDRTGIIGRVGVDIHDSNNTAQVNNLPQILDSDEQWQQVVSGVVSCAVVDSNGTVNLELNHVKDTNNNEPTFEAADKYYYVLWVKLDQLAQNGGVSWYSKPLATVREKAAA